MYRYGQRYHGGNYISSYSRSYNQYSKKPYHEFQLKSFETPTHYRNDDINVQYYYLVDENQDYLQKYKRNNQSYGKANRSKKQNKTIQDTDQSHQHVWAKSSHKRNDNDVVNDSMNVYRKGQFSQIDIEAELFNPSAETTQEHDIKSIGQDQNDSDVEPSGQQRLYYGHYEYHPHEQDSVQFEKFQISNNSAFPNDNFSNMDHRHFALRRIGPKHTHNLLKKRFNNRQPVSIQSQQYDNRTVPYDDYISETVPYISSPIGIYYDAIETNESELAIDRKDESDNDKILPDEPYKSSDDRSDQRPNTLNDATTYDNLVYEEYVGDTTKGYFAVDGAWYPYPVENVYKYPSNVPDKKRSAIWTLPQIQKQLEYWLSDDNLITDTHLQSLMDSEGWVELSQIAKFSRMKAHEVEVDKIVEAARQSSLIDVHPDGKKIRTKSHEKILSALHVSKDDINKIVDGIMEKYQKQKDKPNTEENVANSKDKTQKKDKKDKNDDKQKNPAPQTTDTGKVSVVHIPAKVLLNANDVRVNLKIQQ